MADPVKQCARTGCLFPIKEFFGIRCNCCGGFYHPACSDLPPENFEPHNSPELTWNCPKCRLILLCDNPPTEIQATIPLLKPKLISYITGNMNKLRETVEILGVEYSSRFTSVNLDLPEYQGSVNEIAEAKCLFAATQVRGPVLVEDTGLGFCALQGLPGPYIKWFLKAVGPAGLHKMLIGFGEDNNAAEATCTFAYSEGQGHPVKLFQGITSGRIVEPRGVSGFGWDPCFLPDGQTLTYAELDKETKNRTSHRFKAIEKLRVFLKQLESSLP